MGDKGLGMRQNLIYSHVTITMYLLMCNSELYTETAEAGATPAQLISPEKKRIAKEH